jgi:hypothetical protein
MLKAVAQLEANKQQHTLDKGVDVLKQLSTQNHKDRQILNKPTKGE